MGLGMNTHLNPAASPMGEKQVASVIPVAEGNRYLGNPEQGLQLCAQLVAVGENSSSAHKKLAELNDLIEEQFLPLTDSDYNTTGAAAYRDLKRICSDLETLIQFPEIERYYTVAVGGMFSAGKSRFLNSVLGCELLPTDTNPTTSIPTYITHGADDAIAVLNKFQSRIGIDEEGLQAICHAFHERFQVSFAHILRLVHVQRRQMKYPGLTLLDTPGYSKSDSFDAAANIDERIAREHLRRADFLIWLIDIQNGTVPQDDLLFIRGLDFRQPILFVLNKADKKTDAEIEQTLAAARKDLAKADDIQVYGVTAYSAAEGREYAGQDCLDRFFQEVSKAKPGTPLWQQTERIFSNYTAFYESEKIRLRQQRGVLNEAAVSCNIEQELRERAKALAAGSRERIDELQLAEKKMAAIRRDALHLVKEIAEATGLPLADRSVPILQHAAEPGGGKSMDVFRFQGNMNQIPDHVLTSLLHKPNLESLRGTVRKIDSLCFYFDVEGDLEAMALAGEVQKVTGLNRAEAREMLPEGTEVSVHLRENKRCVIIYPPRTR